MSEKERKCQIQFSIVPPNQAHYVAETKIIATSLQVAQLQPGQAITVHIDPNNPQNIILQSEQTNVSLEDAVGELRRLRK